MASPLPAQDLADNPTGCCPRFHPDPWENHEFTLEGLSFIRASTRSFLYMPLNMGSVMAQTQKAIDAAGAAPRDRYLVLSRDLSLWRADHWFLVAGPVPGYDLVSLHGTFHSRVFEGSFGQMGAWYKQIEKDLSARGLPLTEVYAFYTTCPNCAKVYGKNYVVLLARILEAA